MTQKAEANKKLPKKNRTKRTSAKRYAVEWPCPKTYTFYTITQMTACRSIWCNTQIPKCNHRVNSQTRENTFSKFQNFTISRTSHSASFWKRGKTKQEWLFMWGCSSLLCRRQPVTLTVRSLKTRRGEKKTCRGVAISLAPRSLHIPPLVL